LRSSSSTRPSHVRAPVHLLRCKRARGGCDSGHWPLACRRVLGGSGLPAGFSPISQTERSDGAPLVSARGRQILQLAALEIVPTDGPPQAFHQPPLDQAARSSAKQTRPSPSFQGNLRCRFRLRIQPSFPRIGFDSHPGALPSWPRFLRPFFVPLAGPVVRAMD